MRVNCLISALSTHARISSSGYGASLGEGICGYRRYLQKRLTAPYRESSAAANTSSQGKTPA